MRRKPLPGSSSGLSAIQVSCACGPTAMSTMPLLRECWRRPVWCAKDGSAPGLSFRISMAWPATAGATRECEGESRRSRWARPAEQAREVNADSIQEPVQPHFILEHPFVGRGPDDIDDAQAKLQSVAARGPSQMAELERLGPTRSRGIDPSQGVANTLWYEVTRLTESVIAGCT